MNDIDVVSWSVTSTDDHGKLDFQFQPRTTPPVAEFIDECYDVMDTLFTIMTEEIQGHPTSIYDFALMECEQNNRPKKHSLYADWKSVTRYQLLKFKAVLTAMGFDKRPWIRDYWSQSPHLFTFSF